MNCWRLLLVTGLLLLSTASSGFESDVHYGLTEWLAIQAGFDERAAKTVAIGDQRVDSGDMQYLELVFAYGCIGKDASKVARLEGPFPTRLCSAAQATSVLCVASLLSDAACFEGNCPRLCGVQESELVTHRSCGRTQCVAALA